MKFDNGKLSTGVIFSSYFGMDAWILAWMLQF